MVPHLELVTRIFVGTALGAVIGYERDLHGRPAGLRTHALVALASSTFMVVSTHFVYAQTAAGGDPGRVDSSRIASTVVSGIGFLAGGAIVRTGLTVQGLTTGAGLWLVAAIGLAAGGGMYIESTFATALGIASLTLMRRLEDKDSRQQATRRVIVTFSGDSASIETLIAAALHGGASTAAECSYERDLENELRTVTLDLRLNNGGMDLSRILQSLEAQPGVRRVKMEPRA